MKKLGILALTTVFCASVYASSLAIPWFVDNAPAANFIPGKANGVTGIVILKSNRTDALTCSITYYSAEGVELGPFAPDNTFVIPALSSVSFRPVSDDPNTTAGGQESSVAQAVPNRPSTDGKKNGSASVSWVGGNSDVQGLVTYFQTSVAPSDNSAVTFSYGSLLPPGF